MVITDLTKGKNDDSLAPSEIAVWLLTSNLIAPNKVGATAPIFLTEPPLQSGGTGGPLLCSSLLWMSAYAIQPCANSAILYEQAQGPLRTP